MLQHRRFPRRGFLRGTAALAAAPLLSTQGVSAGLRAATIYKTLKIGMVDVPGSLTDRFRAAKAAGFDGIELNAPGIDIDDARAAIETAELPVDGTVCSSHWKIRHTSPDPDQRANALEDLREALRQTHAIGGHTVLLVVGHGNDGSQDEIRDRSIENISKALPLAAEFGVCIAIENVWNHFLYDHGGGSDQTADRFIQYVDELNSPWLGMQFDIGNHWKYGNMGDWIRALGQRIVKLDAKGFSRETDRFTKIGQGDLDWVDVRRALAEINFSGWCAAEVAGGGPSRLAEISANMDRVFDLKRRQ